MKHEAEKSIYHGRTQLSSPRKNSIKKKMIAQNCGKGNIPIASGYVMNANDGPPVATDETGNPVTSTKLSTTWVKKKYLKAALQASTTHAT